ncbi:unnamed protein product [Leuciscus chuanchicus]
MDRPSETDDVCYGSPVTTEPDSDPQKNQITGKHLRLSTNPKLTRFPLTRPVWIRTPGGKTDQTPREHPQESTDMKHEIFMDLPLGAGVRLRRERERECVIHPQGALLALHFNMNNLHHEICERCVSGWRTVPIWAPGCVRACPLIMCGEVDTNTTLRPHDPTGAREVSWGQYSRSLKTLTKEPCVEVRGSLATSSVSSNSSVAIGTDDVIGRRLLIGSVDSIFLNHGDWFLSCLM